MKNDTRETITLVELIEEIFREEARVGDDMIILLTDIAEIEDTDEKEYAKKQRKEYLKYMRSKFRELVQLKGGKIEEYQSQNKQYIVPVEEQASIKLWLKEYGHSGIRKIRKNEDHTMTFDENIELIEALKKNVKEGHYLEDLKERELEEIEELNKYHGNIAARDTIRKLKDLVENNIDDLIKDKYIGIGYLKDRDYEALTFLYEEMTMLIVKLWKKIVIESDEYRQIEMMDRIAERINEDDSDKVNKETHGDSTDSTLQLENPLNMIHEVTRDILEDMDLKSEILYTIDKLKESK